MTFMVLMMLAVCIGMPLAYAWRLFRLNEPTMGAWLLIAAEVTVLVALVLLVGRWDMAGHYVRFLVMAAFLIALFWSFRKHAARPWRTPRSDLGRRWPTLVSLVLFGVALAYVVYGILPPEGVRNLAFPLKDGRFMVGQGGSVSLLNHHAGHDEQRFAADITALNEKGFRAEGLMPDKLEAYEIYGATVVSPCNGTVVATQDDLADLTPPEADPEHPRGNHVIIDCGTFDVELAHLQKGSVAVRAGRPVRAGERVGRVGNSGNTTEPHLHVHAVDHDTRRGLPISFEGHIPVRNRLYVK